MAADREVAPRRSSPWIGVGLAIALAIAFFAIGAPRLAEPPSWVFDESYYLPSALQYVLGLTPLDFAHPPGAKLFMALAVWLTGVEDPLMGQMPTQVFAARLMSLVVGALGVTFAYGLGSELTGRRAGGLLAGVLLMLDSAYFVHSRLALTNIYGTVFILLGAWGAVRYLRTGKPLDMMLCGLGLGLAASCRWTGLVAWALIGLGLAGALLLGRTPNRPTSPAAWAWLIGAGAVFPTCLYLASHIPLMLQGAAPGVLTSWDGRGRGWRWVLELQLATWRGQSASIYGQHPYLSPWWSWPLLLRPAVYQYHEWVRPELWRALATPAAAAVVSDPRSWEVQQIWAIGNPFVWWASLPALLAAVGVGLKRARPAVALLGVVGLGLWAFWGLAPRSYTFAHYYLEVVPLACVLLAAGALHMRAAWGRFGAALTSGYVTLAAGWMVLVFPLLTGETVSMTRRVMLLWFGPLWR